ncbi:hypothetical protein LINPERPRIM_LOCUS16278 [Linum perenne]
MSRSNFRESLVSGGGGGGGGGRALLAASHHLHRRGHSLNSLNKDSSDENLDLFSKNRRSLSLAPSDEASDASVKLGRLSLGSAKVVPRGGIEDLLSSAEGGKNDYDWLLTPPGTPLFPSTDANESHPPSVAPRTSGMGRSISTAKSSRLSVSQSETYHHPTRPARSSSVTRSSSSASHFNTYSSNRSPSSILNTSSASVSSYTRPSSPVTRSPSIGRPSTPSGRSTGSRPSTPSRARPSPSVSLPEKTRPSQTSRPSTPSSSRPQTPTSSNHPPPSRSRPSTPTRRTPSSVTPTTSAGRPASNGRMSAPSSRPSSPSPRVRSTQQPVVPPDFSLDTPPNLRTTLPDRPLSAGRSRPGKPTPDSPVPASTAPPRRNSSPIVTRGRVSEPPGRGRIHSNGHAPDIPESRRSSHGSDPAARRHPKPSATASESTGFGRTISKKSIDMAVRHMDIRNGAGGTRPLSGTTLFPQSIRGSSTHTQTVRSSTAYEPNGNSHLHNGDPAEINGHYSVGRTHHQAGNLNEGRQQFARLGEGDIYESSRYDAMLLKEDVKNMNWLHSVDDDDKFDQASIFDHGFESLPEPFSPL